MRLAKGAANPKRELPDAPITAKNVVFYVVEGQEAPIGQKTRSLARTLNREGCCIDRLSRQDFTGLGRESLSISKLISEY